MTRQIGAERDDEVRAGVVQGIDPRARIIGAVLFAVVIVSRDDLWSLVMGLIVALFVMLGAGLPLGQTLKRMAAMDGFIVFMLLMLPFTVPGDALFSVAGFPATWQGLHLAVAIALKANAVVLALMALVGSMSMVTFGHALSRLRVPVNLVHLLLFTVRYIDVLKHEYTRLRTAMKARGFQPDNSLHTLKTFGYLIGMMLVRALERSERILMAMKCRGFSGTLPLLDDFRFRLRDGVFCGGVVICCGVLVTLEVWRAAPF